MLDTDGLTRLNEEPYWMNYLAWEACFVFLARGWHTRILPHQDADGYWRGYDVWGRQPDILKVLHISKSGVELRETA